MISLPASDLAPEDRLSPAYEEAAKASFISCFLRLKTLWITSWLDVFAYREITLYPHDSGGWSMGFMGMPLLRSSPRLGMSFAEGKMRADFNVNLPCVSCWQKVGMV